METEDYEAQFTPEDTEHYEIVCETLQLEVKKAQPKMEIPYICGIKFEEGMRLSDIALPEGWKWKEDAYIEKGKMEYEAVFTPADLKNYEILEKLITVITDQINTPLPQRTEIPIHTEIPFRTDPPVYTEIPPRTE